MKTQEIPAATLNGATLLRNGTLVGERFRYDQNSNMRKVKRWAMTSATQSQMIDDAVMLSNSSTVNSVNQIVDVGVSLPANPSEISSLTPPAGAGLTNSAGQFLDVPTAVNPVEIEYNSSGVVDVYQAMNNELRYVRDPFGFHSRVDKYQTNGAATSFQRSFYPIVIDGRSDRAVYQRTAEQPIPEIDQWTIMSTRRLGVRHWSNEGAPLGNISLRSMGDVRYELSLTTGTVAGTITDVKVPTSAGYHAEMVSVGSYDLYGGEHWNRAFSSVAPHRYGWHGLRSLLGEDERSHYYTPFRLYDVRMGSWTSRDKVLSTGMGPYTGMDASPIDAVDPDGLLVMFVNGFRFGGQGTVTVRNVYMPGLGPTLTNGQFAQVISSDARYFLQNRKAIWENARAPVYDTDINAYWGDFAPRFMNLLGDHNDVYLDGSAGPVSEAWEREAAGIAAGKQLVDDIRSGKVKLADGEIITVVSHSQGDAYGAGVNRALVAAGIPVHTIYRIAPKQPEHIRTDPSVKRSVQLFSPDDFIAPQAAVLGNGATQMVYWELPEEYRPRPKLPGLFGTLLGESLFLKTGGFHTIGSYLPYLDPSNQKTIKPARVIPVNATPIEPSGPRTMDGSGE